MRKLLVQLGGVFASILVFVAALTEILNWLGVTPAVFFKTATGLLALAWAPIGPHHPEPKGPGRRPARLVLIVENRGGAASMKHVSGLLEQFAGRLVLEDSVSLITFPDGKLRWILEDLPGDRASVRIREKARALLSVPQVSERVIRAAISEAQGHLRSERRSGMNSAVVFLAPETPETAPIDWFEKIQSDNRDRVLILGHRVVASDPPLWTDGCAGVGEPGAVSSARPGPGSAATGP